MTRQMLFGLQLTIKCKNKKFTRNSGLLIFLTSLFYFNNILETNKAVDSKIDGSIQKPPPKWGLFVKKSDFES